MQINNIDFFIKKIKKIFYIKILSTKNNKEKFSLIFKKNLWSDSESVSGSGSNVLATESIRRELPRLIKNYQIHNILDIPCGDFNWMKFVLHDVNDLDVKYTGVDIVSEIVDLNNNKYSNNKIEFLVADVCKDTFQNTDLLLVRDLLIHFSYKDIDSFLKNISKIKYKYLLINTHIVRESFLNTDINTGEYRKVDLFSHPFFINSKDVLTSFEDSMADTVNKRVAILLKKSSVPTSLNF